MDAVIQHVSKQVDGSLFEPAGEMAFALNSRSRFIQ